MPAGGPTIQNKGSVFGGGMQAPIAPAAPVHPAAAAGRSVLGPTPFGPANPQPQGAPMGGPLHPATQPVRPPIGPRPVM